MPLVNCLENERAVRRRRRLVRSTFLERKKKKKLQKKANNKGPGVNSPLTQQPLACFALNTVLSQRFTIMEINPNMTFNLFA